MRVERSMNIKAGVVWDRGVGFYGKLDAIQQRAPGDWRTPGRFARNVHRENARMRPAVRRSSAAFNARGRRYTRGLSGFASLLAVLFVAAGCGSAPPMPPVNITEPGWTVRPGLAVWKRQRAAPEIAGDILIATRPDGRAFVQFSKNPFPLVIAQSAPNQWQVDSPTDGKHYSGRGNPPARLIFLYVPRALAGLPLPRNWAWQKLDTNSWRLENLGNGESLEVHFLQ